MKKLAIALIAVTIFSISWHDAQAQVELNKNQQKSNEVSTTQELNTRQTNADTPQTAETPKVAQTPEPETKAPEIAPKQAEPAPIGCGSHDPSTIYGILTEIGVPRSSAIQLLGSWQTESGGGFNQCQQIGDGGQAWGLNSWHPNRRYDMPMELRAQINWAVHIEMKRDCASCYQTLMAGGDAWTIRSAIKQTTRWGIEGARWAHADRYASMF